MPDQTDLGLRLTIMLRVFRNAVDLLFYLRILVGEGALGLDEPWGPSGSVVSTSLTTPGVEVSTSLHMPDRTDLVVS